MIIVGPSNSGKERLVDACLEKLFAEEKMCSSPAQNTDKNSGTSGNGQTSAEVRGDLMIKYSGGSVARINGLLFDSDHEALISISNQFSIRNEKDRDYK